MPEMLTPAITETAIDTLETMAFISAMPLEEGQATAPVEPLLGLIRYDGPASGKIEMMLPRDLAKMMAANLLGGSPEEESVASRAEDCAREFLNILCGNLLSSLSPEALATVRMSLPEVRRSDASTWEEFVASGRGNGLALLDAEGSPLAIRVQEVA